MFRRMFWFLTGAATGVWATVKVNRAVRRLSPESLAAKSADRALETGARLRLFARDVRAGMAQREGELQDALGLTGRDQPKVLPAGGDRTTALPAGDDTAGRPGRTSDLPAARRGITYNAHDRKDDH
ncbi:DUF6167 family protein [Actinacidiphila rubida]|uniref:Secreted protein n=1 Tax=Actinacidiphila rubida TaxID=310780 RepID=A0A1H8K1H1_9ACTN|nr:DUF6167 family protein [Actinacidiphila rubida]SEN86849.1 hypothetical protein SAMN05216267_1011178 [Actinacidiphila rubida]